MSRAVVISHASSVDAEWLLSSAGRRERWRDLDLDPARGLIRWHPVFGSTHPGFRRMDLLTRVLVIAAELLIAAEVSGLDALTPAKRTDTALIFASHTGCLAADLRFEQSLHRKAGIEPALFPYTLPSTALGEVAIRHRLQGPTLCLPVARDHEHAGLIAGAELIEDGEASAALVLLGDWVGVEAAARAGIGAKTHVVALLLQEPGADTPCFAATDAARTATMSWTAHALEHR
jgi:3-oxoacyl-(acyl-carrier-protein) synthase